MLHNRYVFYGCIAFIGYRKTGTLAISKDPDEMPAVHQGMRCLLFRDRNTSLYGTCPATP